MHRAGAETFLGWKSQFGQAESAQQSMCLHWGLHRVSRAGTQLPQQYLGADPGSEPPREGHGQAVPSGNELLLQLPASSAPAPALLGLIRGVIRSPRITCRGISVPLLLGTARQEFQAWLVIG